MVRDKMAASTDGATAILKDGNFGQVLYIFLFKYLIYIIYDNIYMYLYWNIS